MKIISKMMTVSMLFSLAVGCGPAQDFRDANLAAGSTNQRPKVLQVSPGSNHACALTDQGVRCWGDHWASNNLPSLVNPSFIASSHEFSCAIHEDIQHPVKCWGDKFGFWPAVVPHIDKPVSISLGHRHACVLSDNGIEKKVICWGKDYNRAQFTPPPLLNPSSISTGDDNSCALTDEGLVCWGPNDYGQTEVPHLLNPQAVSVGHHTCAITDDGVRCWGRNDFSQSEVPHLPVPKAVVVGYDFSCALSETGLHCWGSDYLNLSELKLPFDIEAEIESISASDSGVWGVMKSGGIKSWGASGYLEGKLPEDLKAQ